MLCLSLSRCLTASLSLLLIPRLSQCMRKRKSSFLPAPEENESGWSHYRQQTCLLAAFKQFGGQGCEKSDVKAGIFPCITTQSYNTWTVFHVHLNDPCAITNDLLVTWKKNVTNASVFFYVSFFLLRRQNIYKESVAIYCHKWKGASAWNSFLSHSECWVSAAGLKGEVNGRLQILSEVKAVPSVCFCVCLCAPRHLQLLLAHAKIKILNFNCKHHQSV